MLNKCKFCGGQAGFITSHFKGGCYIGPDLVYSVTCPVCRQTRGEEKSYEEAEKVWNDNNPSGVHTEPDKT